MSWKLGKSKSKGANGNNLAIQDLSLSPRSTTPTPGNPNGKLISRSGILAIRVLWSEGLTVPGQVPPAVQSALSSQQAKAAASVSPSSVTQHRLANSKKGARDSVQRQQCWWLPYLVMEFEVNQVMITPLGGEMEKPLYMYETHL